MNLQQDIIDRLAFLIDELFPDTAFCDIEDVQNVEPPRFFITCYSSSVKPRIKNAGFFYTCSYDLVFDPGEVEQKERVCNETVFCLLPALLKIPKEDGKNFRADNINSKYDSAQGVSHIFFDVTYAILPETEEIPDILHKNFNTQVEVV